MTDAIVTADRLREMLEDARRLEPARNISMSRSDVDDLISVLSEALALRTPSEGEVVAKLSAAVQRLIGRGNAILGYCETPEAIEAGAAQAYTNWKREADVSMALALAALAPSPQPVAEAVFISRAFDPMTAHLFTSPQPEGLGIEVKQDSQDDNGGVA